jgi:hypothetical protein
MHSMVTLLITEDMRTSLRSLQKAEAINQISTDDCELSHNVLVEMVGLPFDGAILAVGSVLTTPLQLVAHVDRRNGEVHALYGGGHCIHGLQ